MLQPAELDGATERFLIDADARATDHRDMALGAAAGATAAAVDLIEASRGEMPVWLNLVHRETGENLADALRSTLAIEVEGLTSCERAPANIVERIKAGGVLLAAVQEFLEGWGE